MKTLEDQTTANSIRRVARWCGGAVVFLGALGILGWAFGLRVLGAIRPQYIPMAPSTAAAFLFLGFILLMQAHKELQGWGKFLAGALAALVSTYGLLNFVFYYAGIAPTFEISLFPITERLGSIPDKRMSPITGLIFFLSGTCLLLILRPRPQGVSRHLPGVLGSLVIAAGFICTLGYLFGTPLLYTSNTIPVAATTAFAFLLLGIGLMSAAGPECFPLRLIVGPTVRARLMRAFLPLTAGAILIHGLLHGISPELLNLDHALESALLTIVFLTITWVVVALVSGEIAGALDRAEAGRKKADEELKLKERLLDSASDSIFLHDLDGHFLYVNEAAYKSRGYGKDELLTKDLSVLPTSEYAGNREELISELLAKGQTIFESAHLRKDGSIMPVEIHARTIDLNHRRLVLSVARDITDRKRAAEELRVAAHKWRTTFDAIGDGVCLLDRESKIRQCNQAMAALVGKPFAEIVGRHCWEVVHGTAAPIEGCPVVRMRESRRRATLTLPLGDRWLQVMADPILNEVGEVTGGVHIVADITQRKRAEDKIRELNTLLTAIKNINEALLWVKSEPELFQQICDLMAGVPYVRFTWIGLVEPDSFEVKAVAWAGVEEGYLSAIKVTWDDSPHGRGPTGMAIKTGQPVSVGDIATDLGFLPWREEAQRRGYASSIALPLIYEEVTLGTLNVYSGEKHAFGEEEQGFLQQVAGDIAMGLRSLRLAEGLEKGLRQLQAVMQQTVEAIASMAEMRDLYTAGHQRGVTQLACALATETGLDEHRLEGLRVAGFLHDIGKIVVPSEILNKPGRINKYEFSIIKTHSQAGYEILKNIDFPWPVAQIVLQHHERWNGSGYPQGLAGQDILLEARILMVADVVEAMAAHRPYRPAMGIDIALEEISQKKGVLYDTEVVEACLRLFTEQGYKFQ